MEVCHKGWCFCDIFGFYLTYCQRLSHAYINNMTWKWTPPMVSLEPPLAKKTKQTVNSFFFLKNFHNASRAYIYIYEVTLITLLKSKHVPVKVCIVRYNNKRIICQFQGHGSHILKFSFALWKHASFTKPYADTTCIFWVNFNLVKVLGVFMTNFAPIGKKWKRRWLNHQTMCFYSSLSPIAHWHAHTLCS